MPQLTPTWSDNVVVLAQTTIALGGVASATLDLTAKYGAFLFIRVGRTTVTAPTNGLDVRVNRQVNGLGGAGLVVEHPGSHFAPRGGNAAAAQYHVTTDSAAGQNVLNTTNNSGTISPGDFVVIGPNTVREEYARVSKISGGTITLDRPLQFSHTVAQGADNVFNASDIYPPVWCPGGAVYEVVVDYGNSSAGGTVTVSVFAQTYNSDGI